MSSATSLYAVNLDAVRAAIGSADEALRTRAQAAWEPKVPARGPTAEAILLPDGTAVFDGRPFDAESLRAELARPAWNGLFIRLVEQRPRYLVLSGQISPAVVQVIFDAMNQGTIVGKEWVEAAAVDAEEFTVEQAIDELISGQFADRDEDDASEYGYALERVCAAVGTHLGTIEGDVLLSHLKLKTPLSRRKRFTPLPRIDAADVPAISFLTAEEVASEHERLAGLDLAYPRSDEIECGRREYAAIVAKAREQSCGILAFGY